MVNLRDKGAAIVSGLLFVIWLAAMFAFGKITSFPARFFMALAFGTLAFVVNIILLFTLGKESSERNEIKHIPSLISTAYLVVALAANFAFSFPIAKLGMVVFFNIFCICIAVGGNIFSNNYVRGTERTVNIIENKQSMHRLLSQKIGKALALSNDGEVKAKLLKLKELSDYSNALTTNMSEDVEDVLYNKLSSLENMLIQGEDKDKILERIEDIIVDVKYRNTIKSI